MAERLYVYLHGHHAGTLDLSRGEVTFTYTDSWRQSDSSIPLSLSMPLAKRNHPAAVVMPFIDGLLPDDEDVRRRWQRTYDESRSTPFALLRHTGLDCAGAVQICPPDADPGLPADGDSAALSEKDIADHLSQLRRDPSAWNFADHGGQFSLAGAQSKFALALNNGTWERPSGNLPTTHIVKPGITGLDASALNEHLCLECARHLGINAASSRLLSFEDQVALVVDRYDRVIENGEVHRIHQEDLCQALGYYPHERYENEGGPGIAATCGLLREAAAPTVGTESVKRFLEANAFNWLIAGTDAHAKNYSVLLTRRQVRLAPMYDAASLAPYAEYSYQKAKLAMRVDRHYRISSIAGRHWTRTATSVGIDPDAFLTRLRELAGQLSDAFSDAARAADASRINKEFTATLVDAMAARSEQALRAL